MKRFAKIVATIGPSCEDKTTLRNLILAGVNIARLNFSHGTHEWHNKIFNDIREISNELNIPVTILQDLQGPKIRIGELKKSKIELKPGNIFRLTSKPIIGNQDVAHIDFPQLITAVNPGDKILIDDGNLELEVQSVNSDEIFTKVILGGFLLPHKGVNLPYSNMTIPGFTNKDKEDLSFGLKLGIDAVAISFVRTVDDIIKVKETINNSSYNNSNIPIIAKIEKPEALNNLDAIINITDGVMVARGDLGVELSPEEVPIAQKRIIQTANFHGKLVITATQMLGTMITNPRPSRAEASDVANAVFDGTDALMLSGETASGKYPIESVKMMDEIICEAEKNFDKWGQCQKSFNIQIEDDDATFVARAACELARDRNVATIAAFTVSGKTAMKLSKSRPDVPILAFTPLQRTYQKINLYWGVSPELIKHASSLEEMIEIVENSLINIHKLHAGQQVVLVCGFPISASGPTNLALLHTLCSRNN